jgi:hypothetical protein
MQGFLYTTQNNISTRNWNNGGLQWSGAVMELKLRIAIQTR